MSADERLDAYLKTVTAQLGSASFDQREKIAAEIAEHVQASAEGPGESVDAALRRLGPPESLGERYREILMTSEASRSYAPTVLLMASFRRGILGVMTALVGLAGYWLGGILLVFGMLALIWAVSHPGPHVPIGASMRNLFKIVGLGFLLVAFSTFLLRTMLRLLGRWQSPI